MTTEAGTGAAGEEPGFRHEAAFYEGLDDLVGILVSFVLEGVRAGEAVMVAELPRPLEALEEVLADEPDARGADIVFIDMTEVGKNPACIIPVWREFLGRHADRPVRGVGEPAWWGRRDVELVECRLHEALTNVAFDEAPAFHLLCPYDVARLPHDVVTSAMYTHPHVGGQERLASYGGHAHAFEEFGSPLPPAPPTAQMITFGEGDLALLRTSVRFIGEGARLQPDVVEDLVLAVHELASNSIEHGGGRGLLRGWSDAVSLVLEVSDRGVIADPLVGREPALDVAEGGRGIWMANHLCDLVQVRSSHAGTTVRLHTWT